jgi:glycosyltransferase involved in cell wall biosynthesis
MTCGEEMTHQAKFKDVVEKVRPDVVMAYGGRILDRDNYRWLRDQNIPTIFYLANPNYRLADSFRDISLIITDSQATADLYRDRLGLNLRPLGKVVAPVSIAKEAQRDCVTFVNPAPQKGSAVFVAIAQEAVRRGLTEKFLVVESRDTLDRTLKALALSSSDIPNVTCLPLQENLNSVWSRTRVLLSPSLWHESGSRTIVEACSAGIPVLATDSGGTSELLGEAGFLFPKPTEKEEEYLKPVGPEIAKEWTDVLEKLLTDKTFYERASETASARWQQLSQHDLVAKLEECFKGLLAGKRHVIST